MLIRKTNQYKSLKIPREFDLFIDNLALDISKNTGYKKNKVAALRKLAELDGKLIWRNNRFDWRIL